MHHNRHACIYTYNQNQRPCCHMRMSYTHIPISKCGMHICIYYISYIAIDLYIIYVYTHSIYYICHMSYTYIIYVYSRARTGHPSPSLCRELQLRVLDSRTPQKYHQMCYFLQQGRLWSSFASCNFPGLIIGRKFSKLRQSTAFYYAHRTIFCAKEILSGTYLSFCVKVGKKIVEIWDPKNILKIISARKKMGEIFYSTIQALFLSWTMTKNDFGAHISRAVMVLFLIFTQIIIQICTVTWPYV